MKKFVSVIFIIVIFFINTAINIQAEKFQNLTYTITDEQVTIESCEPSVSGVVEIPDKIEGYPVTAIGGLAFYECEKITQIILPDSIKSIGNLAFGYCTQLKAVNIPENVTSIGSGMLWFCSGLEEITVSNGNEVYYSTDNCLIKRDTNELVAGCKTSVIPNVTKIGNGAFNGCTELTSINIPDSVEVIEALAFSNCKALKNIRFSENLIKIGTSAFNTCVGLQSVTIPESVKELGGSAFYYCTGLTEIDIPKNVESIGASAFYGCENLVSVKISEKVKTIDEYAFYKCENLKNITVDENNSVFYSKGNCLIKKSNNSILLACNTSIIPEEAVSISYDSFSGCTKMTYLYIPKNIVKINNSAFYGCNKIKTVYYEGSETDWDNMSITTSGNAALTKADKVFDYQIAFGDVNNDTFINKKDVLAISKYLANALDEINVNAADVFYDCLVNKKDLLKIKQYLVNDEVSLGK